MKKAPESGPFLSSTFRRLCQLGFSLSFLSFHGLLFLVWFGLSRLDAAMYRKPITPFRSCPADTNSAALCLAAPAAVQQDGGTTSCNVGTWLSFADFLTLQNLRIVLAARASAFGKRSADADARAGLSTLPDGNHGEIIEVVKA